MANKKASFYCINVKIQSEPNPKAIDYQKLIGKVFYEDGFINYTSDKAIAFKTQFPGLLIHKGNEISYQYGKLVRFTMIEGNSWYDRGKKDYSDVEIPDGMYPNAMEIDYVFIPSIHRFIFRKGLISVGVVEKFIQTAFTQSAENNQIVVATFEKSKGELDKILNAKHILSLDIEVSYTNDDIGDEAQEIMDKMLKDAGIGLLNSQLRADANGKIDNKSKYVRGLLELSKDNGFATASIVNNLDKKEKIETQNHPEITSIEIEDENQGNESIVREFLKKFPR